MMRHKKLVAGVALAVVLLFGGLGGVILAQENVSDSQPGTLSSSIWNRVAEILQDDGVDITSEQLKDAFIDARGEMHQAALENRLAKLVEEGVIDETQAQDYLNWWQSRPDDFPMKSVSPGLRGHVRLPGMFTQLSPAAE